MSGRTLSGHHRKPGQVGLWVGVGVVPPFLVLAFAFGLLEEGVILVSTAAACSLSLIPLVVDRRAARALDDAAVTHG